VVADYCKYGAGEKLSGALVLKSHLKERGGRGDKNRVGKGQGRPQNKLHQR